MNIWRSNVERRNRAYTLSQYRKAKQMSNKPIYFLIGILLVLVVFIGLLLFSRQLHSTEVSIALNMYCIDNNKAAACTSWTNMQLAGFKPLVERCYMQYPYPDFKAAFYACIAKAGL